MPRVRGPFPQRKIVSSTSSPSDNTLLWWHPTDQILYYWNGGSSQWLSVVTYQVNVSHGNQHPYPGAKEMAWHGAFCSIATGGIPVEHAIRLTRCNYHSSEGIAIPQGVRQHIYVNGVSQDTRNWSGSSYVLDYAPGVNLTDGDEWQIRYEVQVPFPPTLVHGGRITGEIFYRRIGS